jgi:hypothetical protein
MSLPPGAIPFPFYRLLQAQYSGIPEPRRVVIRDPAAWETLWDEARRVGSLPPAPSVDFTRDMVLVVAMGLRPTGGYRISVDAVYRAHGGVFVVVREISPGAGAMVTQVLTAPLDLVRVPRTDEAVTFISPP